MFGFLLSGLIATLELGVGFVPVCSLDFGWIATCSYSLLECLQNKRRMWCVLFYLLFYRIQLLVLQIQVFLVTETSCKSLLLVFAFLH